MVAARLYTCLVAWCDIIAIEQRRSLSEEVELESYSLQK